MTIIDRAAATIIERKKSILLLRRSCLVDRSGLWDLPGGFVKRGKTLAEAASREILEKTGLIAKPEWLFRLKGDQLPLQTAFFYTTHARGQVTLNWESDERAWVPLGRALCNGPAILRDFHLVPGAEKAIKVFYHIYP
jgi:ADP-ribose pyrophosphatase YjhB (NUDIX family)